MAESISPDLRLVARGSPIEYIEATKLDGYCRDMSFFLFFCSRLGVGGRERACGRRLVGGCGGRTAAGDISSSSASVNFEFRNLTPGELDLFLSLAAACRETDAHQFQCSNDYHLSPSLKPPSTTTHDPRSTISV